jgi:dTDP-4-dehydrorhamnose 3,5-epimerase-like enzyme
LPTTCTTWPSSSLSLDLCRIIEFPRIPDERGNLTFVEGSRHIPFDIRRVFYLYDVPGGATRAGHGHKRLQQVIVAISGSFDVTLDDGFDQRTYHLNRSYYGLYVPSLVWRELTNFSSGSVCLVFASEAYSEDDYYREHGAFLEAARRR